MAEKSKILVIGGTGYLGKLLAEASAKSGHATFALVRESTVSDPQKSEIIDRLKSYGVTLLNGDIHDHESLVKAIKKVDVVISGIGGFHTADQVKIIEAIKEAGNVKRFLPSEFGADVDRSHPVEPAASFFNLKAKIRRVIEAERIPYTYIVSNAFAGYFLPSLGQPNAQVPPRDEVVILGDGNAKAIIVAEEDVTTYTIKAADDPRTLNKILYMRPPANILSFNEIVSLWEKKIGNTLSKIYIPQEQIFNKIRESLPPLNLMLAFIHATFVTGDATKYEIEDSFGVEASQLYPEVKYTTVEEFLDKFV